MAYQFYLDDIMLPVAPSKCTLKIKNRNKTINLINDGEVNLIKDVGLSEISFDMRIPSEQRPYANYADSLKTELISFASKTILNNDFMFKPVSDYIEALEKLKTSNKPFTFIVTRMTPGLDQLFDYQMLVTLETYSIQEDAGDGFDVTIPITLKQYKDYGTKEVEVTTDENGNQTVKIKQDRTSLKSMDKAVKVQKEKSIWEVCKKAANGSLNWKNVANMNGILNPAATPKEGAIITVGGGILSNGASSITGGLKSLTSGIGNVFKGVTKIG